MMTRSVIGDFRGVRDFVVWLESRYEVIVAPEVVQGRQPAGRVDIKVALNLLD